MSCDRARRLFGACWDDELTHAEREWLEGHLGRLSPVPERVRRVLARARARRRAAPGRRPARPGRARARALPSRGGGAGRAAARPARWVPALAAAAAVAVLALAVLFVLPRAPWRGPGSGGSPQMAASSGGPAVPVLVSSATPDRAPAQQQPGGGRTAVAADDPFDHSADVEFILDPVSVTRGRATVSHAGSRRPDAEGERAIISF